MLQFIGATEPKNRCGFLFLPSVNKVGACRCMGQDVDVGNDREQMEKVGTTTRMSNQIHGLFVL